MTTGFCSRTFGRSRCSLCFVLHLPSSPYCRRKYQLLPFRLSLPQFGSFGAFIISQSSPVQTLSPHRLHICPDLPGVSTTTQSSSPVSSGRHGELHDVLKILAFQALSNSEGPAIMSVSTSNPTVPSLDGAAFVTLVVGGYGSDSALLVVDGAGSAIIHVRQGRFVVLGFASLLAIRCWHLFDCHAGGPPPHGKIRPVPPRHPHGWMKVSVVHMW